MSRLRTLYPHPPNYLDHAAEALAAVPGYDFREPVDRPLIAELMRDYPEIDLIEQI